MKWRDRDPDEPIPPEEWSKLPKFSGYEPKNPEIVARNRRIREKKKQMERELRKERGLPPLPSDFPKEKKPRMPTWDVKRAQHLRDTGMLTTEEIGKIMGVHRATVEYNTHGKLGRHRSAPLKAALELDIRGLNYYKIGKALQVSDSVARAAVLAARERRDEIAKWGSLPPDKVPPEKWVEMPEKKERKPRVVVSRDLVYAYTCEGLSPEEIAAKIGCTLRAVLYAIEDNKGREDK